MHLLLSYKNKCLQLKQLTSVSNEDLVIGSSYTLCTIMDVQWLSFLS
jgi:hypothetical protein